MTESLLRVEGLQKYYSRDISLLDKVTGQSVEPVKAVDNISFEVRKGETLGLVGESGCGKSTTGETILRLREATDGEVFFDGEDILKADDLNEFRRRMQIVFQDPYSSLDPRMTIGEIIREPLDVHDIGSKSDREDRVKTLLNHVRLSEKFISRYPHEFSGGQRQRIGIARALALEPDFIILDEPVSGLDVSIQAQILNLLQDLQDEFDLTYLFVAHDLSVVRYISDRVAVMYLGEIVEIGSADEIFDDPKHPYTQALIRSVPQRSTDARSEDFEPLSGAVPSPRNPPNGCRFHTRCPDARRTCQQEKPPIVTEESTPSEHESMCFRSIPDHQYWESQPLKREPATTSQ